MVIPRKPTSNPQVPQNMNNDDPLYLFLPFVPSVHIKRLVVLQLLHHEFLLAFYNSFDIFLQRIL